MSLSHQPGGLHSGQGATNSYEDIAAEEQYQSSRILSKNHQTFFDSRTDSMIQANDISVRTPGYSANEKSLQTAQSHFYIVESSNRRASQSLQIMNDQAMSPIIEHTITSINTGISFHQLPMSATMSQIIYCFSTSVGNVETTGAHDNYQIFDRFSELIDTKIFQSTTEQQSQFTSSEKVTENFDLDTEQKILR